MRVMYSIEEGVADSVQEWQFQGAHAGQWARGSCCSVKQEQRAAETLDALSVFWESSARLIVATHLIVAGLLITRGILILRYAASGPYQTIDHFHSTLAAAKVHCGLYGVKYRPCHQIGSRSHAYRSGRMPGLCEFTGDVVW